MARTKRTSSPKVVSDDRPTKVIVVEKKEYDATKTLESISVKVQCKNESQKKLIKSIKENEITIVSGLSGTGKTFMACAEALRMLKNHEFKQIILVKSVTPLKGEETGFLPGDIKEKLEPFMISFIDNFEKIIGESSTAKLREMGLINIQPLTYVRGRSIDNALIIADECQNISIDNMKTLLTRIGDNSKMILLGDSKQKDIKNKKESSLEIVFKMFDGVENFGCVSINNTDHIVRNKIIKIIEEKFDQYEEQNQNKTH
jgi:phosphate starvation-inducible PhoH-like protein